MSHAQNANFSIMINNGHNCTGNSVIALADGMFAACGSNAMYPRTKEFIWVDDHTNLIGHKTAAVKINELVEYCQKAKISKVVFGHLEDVFREDVSGLTFSNYPNAANNNVNHPANGITIRSNMKNTIKLLHQNNITEYAQWLDDRTGAAPNQGVYNLDPTLVTNGGNYNSTYSYDDEVSGGSITHWDEEYDAFIEFNKPANNPNADERFDGIMLDYEYWTQDYGSPTVNYGFARLGFENWITVANTCLNARTNSATTGVKFVQSYLNAIIFTGVQQMANNVFNWTSGGTTASTTKDNSIEALHYIRDLGFDGLSIGYWNREEFDLTGDVINNDPTTFLTGVKQNNNNESENQRMRYRLELLGQPNSNGDKIKVYLYLRSLRHANGCQTQGDNESYLGDLMLYECYWSSANSGAGLEWPRPYNSNAHFNPTVGVHYMPEVEKLFAYQYLSKEGFVSNAPFPYTGGSTGNQNDPLEDYGNAIIAGFHWFQYGMGPGIDDGLLLTSLSTINTRPGDQVNLVLGLPEAKLANTTKYYTSQTNKSLAKNYSDKAIISLFPNPAKDQTILISNQQVNEIALEDLLGRKITIKVSRLDNENYLIDMTSLANGFYLIKAKTKLGFVKSIPIQLSK